MTAPLDQAITDYVDVIDKASAAQCWPADRAPVDHAFHLWGRGRINQRQSTPDNCDSTPKRAGRPRRPGGTRMSCAEAMRGVVSVQRLGGAQ